ncbi:MAG: class I SAM-dependent methyltransferase [Rhizobiaceae bacterium]
MNLVEIARINGKESTLLSGCDFAVLSFRIRARAEQVVSFLFNDEVQLDWHPIKRPDLPKSISWHSIYLNLPTLNVRERNEVRVQLENKSSEVVSLECKPAEISRLNQVRKEIENKRSRILSLANDGCNVNEHRQIFDVAETDHSPSLLTKTDPISHHPYSNKFREITKKLSEDALILDVGAGFRGRHNSQIVTTEIFQYPSTDVICFGDRIPFRTETFDAIYSNAVLEHVSNPFDVATEMCRVLKPGGYIYSAIPFLQAEHGYPYHYFNATRMGHRKLYEDKVEILSLDVGGAGQPWYIVMRSLGLLRSGLPREVRDDFNKLTIGDILNGTYQDWTSSKFGNCTKEIKWKLAGSTILVGRKVEK